MNAEYIVIAPRIVGNMDAGYSTVYLTDEVRCWHVGGAVNRGFKLYESEDFLIAKVDGRQLVSLQWMDEVRDDDDELAEVAAQLGFEVQS